ncbi:hypothetical protein KUTeg_017314 [Tegillarca granosa]|uniref:Sulfatase N-terminal domain-containing protein n=1 Tax=Tegillarca granosa TaxID=220873 RepID=A0ABQ9EIW8_TEGGR|nr:hypothetical protein KUTeg_017314 [Tegillarca granosa]
MVHCIILGYLGGSENYYTHYRCGDLGKSECGIDFRDNMKPVQYKGQYSTHLYTQKVIDIVNNHTSDQTFMLEYCSHYLIYLAVQAVHSPLQVPDKYVQPYKNINDKNRRIYAGMVAAMDEAVGNITAVFKARGLWDNTVTVFSTDNGGQILSGGNNYPLRGWKGSLWEGGMKGVGFVHSEMLRNKGSKSNALIHVTDWFPTLVSLAGGNLNGTKPLDGFDQWKAISQGADSQREVILHNIDPLYRRSGNPVYTNTFDTSVRAAIRWGDWKLITGNPEHDEILKQEFENLEVTGNWYSNHSNKNKKNVWLFNISEDPTEHTDLSDSKPDLVKQMLDILANYNATAVPCRYPKIDPQANPKYHEGYWGPWQ